MTMPSGEAIAYNYSMFGGVSDLPPIFVHLRIRQVSAGGRRGERLLVSRNCFGKGHVQQ